MCKQNIFKEKDLQQIELNLNNNYQNIKNQISSQTSKDLCGLEFYFKEKYKENHLNILFKSYDCQDIRINPSVITFLFNEKGDFLVEEEIIELENIKDFIKKSIIEERNRRQTETFYISFQITSKIEAPLFNTIIEYTIDGIYLYYEEVSIKKFNKKFCQLSALELHKLMSEFQFAFTSYEVITPPELTK